MLLKRILALIILILAAGIGFFVYKSGASHPFRLGLDLSGGSHLVYKADVSQVVSGQVSDSMDALRDVIERRVNLFGVSEPVVQVQGGGFISQGEHQLIVDLPGVTDLEKAIEMIGQTPFLDFRTVSEDGTALLPTELTGKYLKKAQLQFDPNTREPVVALQFDDAGSEIFAKITKENIGRPLAILLDGMSIVDTTGDGVIDENDLYAKIVQQEITGGQAVITGSLNPQEAKILVGRLNSGALPVPITLLSKQTIGATLGGSAVAAEVKAAIIGFLLVALFLILRYRLPGLVAVVSLCIFIAIMLSLFKLIPVTLTAAGIAGFIISMGIAVDANVLIFERVKEELRSGKTITDAVGAGFSRAWLAIRDSNISSILASIILFWFGTSLIKGFALTLGMGVLVSMFSAITVTRIFLSAINFLGEGRTARFLFSSGLSK